MITLAWVLGKWELSFSIHPHYPTESRRTTFTGTEKMTCLRYLSNYKVFKMLIRSY